MLHTQIQFPSYDVAMAPQLSQKQYKNFVRKVALGGIPEGKVDAEGNQLGACWNWTAYRNKRGYGQSNFATPCRPCGAHRVSAFIVGLTGIKSASDFDQVLHRCDNPSCVNPQHFFIGSDQDNSDDMVEKGRQLRGETHNKAKLTWKQVREIRTLYAAGGISHSQLGEEFGVDKALISYIICNKIWRDESYTPPTKQVRLSQEQRAEVIQLYQQGNTSQQSIAKLYNVGQATIQRILKGQ